MQKSFRLPADLVQILDATKNSTSFVIEAIREKVTRDREAAIAESLQCLGDDDGLVEEFRDSQSKVWSDAD